MPLALAKRFEAKRRPDSEDLAAPCAVFGILCFEAESSVFILRGSFLKGTVLAVRPH
jgi:hypothetical protein